MFEGLISATLLSLVMFAAAPTSTNYVLPSYDIGSGGTDSSSSTNYKLNGTAGTQTGDPGSSTNYRVNGGNNPAQDANVPPAPTLTNPSNYYNQLKLVVNEGNNPSDTKYLIAISSDGFTTTRYVQTDNSIASGYTLSAYRTYSSFGGASGFLILGLTPSTTYQVKVRALHGGFSESGFGPATSGVATVAQSLSFGVTTSLTSTPPFIASFSNLTSGSVSTANADINLALTTNAQTGGTVYILSQSSGLVSTAASATINSATANLASVGSGYGGQIISVAQGGGGPITAQSPFNGSSDNVGLLSSSLQELLTTPGPITTGTSTLRLKAKSDTITPAETDYSDTLSLIAAMNY